MIETMLYAAIAILAAVICFLLYKIYKLKQRGVGGSIVPRVDFERDMRTDMKMENMIADLSEKIADLEGRLEKSESTVGRLIKELAG